MARSNRQRDSEATKAAKAAAAKAAATARQNARRTVTVTATPLEGFMNFIRQQGVVALAIGIVIGTQVKTLVDQLIASFVNPILGLVLPGQGDLSQKKVTLTVSQWEKTAVFSWGQFVYVLISFLTVAAVIYFIIKALKLDKLDKPKS